MRTWMRGIAGLLLGLTLLGGAVAAAAAQGSSSGDAAHAAARFQATAPQSQACAQDTPDAAEASAAQAPDTDNVDQQVQCGNQNGPDTGTDGPDTAGGGGLQAAAPALRFHLLAQPVPGTAPEAETGAGVERENATDAPETDGIVCDQHGDQQGNNVGC